MALPADSKLPPLVSSEDGGDPRAAVLSRLLETEREYVTDLEFLVAKFYRPIREQAILLDGELDCLFGNIEDVAALARSVLDKIEEVVVSFSADGSKVANGTDHCQFVRVYFDHVRFTCALCLCPSHYLCLSRCSCCERVGVRVRAPLALKCACLPV